MSTPPLPPGFVLDGAPAAPPAASARQQAPAAAPTPAPATPAAQPANLPPLPAGFAVDAPQAAEEPGFFTRLANTITGADRRTPETEALPDWSTMPELNQPTTMAGLKTGLGTLMAAPQEVVQVIQANYPGVKVRQDDKGNFLITSSVDGREYAIKPGFQFSDIPRAGSALAAFTPAGRATTVLGAGAASAGTQAVIEASQAATGGDFSAGEVGVAGVLGAAVPAVSNLARAGIDAARRARAPAGTAAPAVAPAGAAAPGAAAAAPVAQPAAAAATIPTEQLAEVAKTAAKRGPASSAAMRLAEQAAPDAKVVAAAKRLGIEEHLQPDHVSSSQAYRELAQAVKSVPTSQARAAELQGLEEVGRRAAGLIDEIGGTTDLSALSGNVKSAMQSTVGKLEAQADDLYAQVAAKIPRSQPVQAPSTLEFLAQQADELGGAARLSPREAKLLASLQGADDAPLTYAFLDRTRKEIGMAMRKATGPFADSESGLLKKLYATLADDQRLAAKQAGVESTFDAAQSAVRLRKGVEDDLVSLFGKELDGSFVGSGRMGLPGAVRAVAQGDATRLVRLIQAVPQEMRQSVVASGLASAFKSASTRGEISFTQYAKWYEGLKRNRQAYAALMSNLPLSARKQLHALYEVSNGISAATRERITTGRIAAAQDFLKDADTLTAKLYDTAQRTGVGAMAATALAPAIGPGAASALGAALVRGPKSPAVQAVDKLITSPEFVQLAKTPAGQARDAAVRRFAASRRFNQFVRAIGSPRELDNRERWIQDAMLARNTSTERQ